jgi:8-oxo-dGTP diphosphatase
MQHSHCSYCGTRYPDGLAWPRVCTGCGETTWSNPLPVAVVLHPVRQPDGRTGLVVIRRDIEPFRGELALPGGFIETGESWREALVRELKEETDLDAVPDEVQLFDVHSSTNGFSLLIFGVLPARAAEVMPAPKPTEEVTEWMVLTEPIELCFPTHTAAMARFFAEPAEVLLSGEAEMKPAEMLLSGEAEIKPAEMLLSGEAEIKPAVDVAEAAQAASA